MLKTNEGPTLEGQERNTGRTGMIVAQDFKVVSDGGADRSRSCLDSIQAAEIISKPA